MTAAPDLARIARERPDVRVCYRGFYLSAAEYDYLDAEARKRKVGPDRLIRLLIGIVARDRMVTAIMDEDEPE